MQNKKIEQFELKLNKIIDKMDQIKKIVNFDSLVDDYKKIKKEKFKIKEKLEKFINDENKLKEIYQEENDIKIKISQYLKEFAKVEIVEHELYGFKKQIISYLNFLDVKKNSIDYQIVHVKFKKNELNKKIDFKYNEKLENEIIDYEKDILKINDEINRLKLLKKPFNYLTFKKSNLNSKISKLKIELKINSKVNLELINNQINILNSNILNKKNLLKIIEKDIESIIKLLNKIDSKLSFKDEDEVSKELSFQVKYLNVWYGLTQALFNVNIDLPKNQIIAIIGPSGCGKSTFLRTLNRINDNISSFSAKGKILLDGEYDIFKLRSIRNRYDKLELSTLRTKVGMIFQQPNPFPMSIYKNVTYGPNIKGIKNKFKLNQLVEKSLKDAGLYEEVKDNLKALGTSLSGGQQQRLCIARAIANEPEILLMDEPTSALDPIASAKIEELIVKLKKHYTIIMVTHSMQQAQRISDKTAFFYQGKLIEYGDTKQIFELPKQKETKEYITGKFG